MAQAEVVILKSILRSSWKEGAVMFKRAVKRQFSRDCAATLSPPFVPATTGIEVLSTEAPNQQICKHYEALPSCLAPKQEFQGHTTGRGHWTTPDHGDSFRCPERP
jgi:hypothetical protein